MVRVSHASSVDIMHFPPRAHEHLKEAWKSLQIILFYLQEYVIAKTNSHASAFIDPEIKPCLEKTSFIHSFKKILTQTIYNIIQASKNVQCKQRKGRERAIWIFLYAKMFPF